ncbi:MAG TPA: hypothetical protein DDW47_06575 [Lactobacillus acetotolerans]|nr:TPM domain-containing protein [Lactobacillus acetotolerans]QGV05118.1 TPM domain-containing protein [Lactobacillus acetotolerans]QJD73860.1 TPM domain-containing protein [Lactobacillus acetotolerans]HBG91727.1 hypothetical protein [Lactobacillus acetotolerans]HCX39597.1 hypothetical protein [Lactobacillus acetotolerans]
MKKQKISLLLITALISIFFTMTGFSEANIQDNAHILDKDTNRLIIEKNDRYFQTKEQPQIIVRTVKRVNKLTPKHLNKFKRTVFIVAGVKKNKHNVQIYSSRDLHSAFTADTQVNIIHAEVSELRSRNKATFNKGLRFVFKACATTIDQQYEYSLDKYDLTNDEQTKISHPHKIALPIALAIALLITGLVYFFKKDPKIKK